jgi:hypothetical protein
VIQRTTFLGGSFEGDLEPVLDLGLPDELIEDLRSKCELLLVFDRRVEKTVLTHG